MQAIRDKMEALSAASQRHIRMYSQQALPEMPVVPVVPKASRPGKRSHADYEVVDDDQQAYTEQQEIPTSCRWG